MLTSFITWFELGLLENPTFLLMTSTNSLSSTKLAKVPAAVRAGYSLFLKVSQAGEAHPEKKKSKCRA